MGSPIEAKLKQAIIETVPETNTLVDCTHLSYMFRRDTANFWPSTESDYDRVKSGDCCVYGSGIPSVLLLGNVSILSYRADLVLSIDRWSSLLIECDGHDFHERTKQQATYDRSRDRELLSVGLVTIRFTGSEIVADPERCAVEAWRCFRVVSVYEELQCDARTDGYKNGYLSGLLDGRNGIHSEP